MKMKIDLERLLDLQTYLNANLQLTYFIINPLNLKASWQLQF